jgi:site-specific DNA-methyltransferase (adenine-specific)
VGLINLLNGDCLELMRDIPDGSIDLILQDPPYNTTACKWEWDIMTKIDEFWAEWLRIAKPNAAIVMTASQPFTTRLIASNYKNFKYCWIWKKEQGTMPMNAPFQPKKIHEDIVVFSMFSSTFSKKGIMNYYPIMEQGEKYNGSQRKSGKMKFHTNPEGIVFKGRDTRYPSSVLNFNCQRGLHPTQKPVALMEYLIKTYTNEGDTVFDGFMGSGTTGVACKNTGRNFIGIELDENYFNIAKERINQ